MKRRRWLELRAALLLSAILPLHGCKLDSLVFNPTAVSEYRFPSAAVPDSLRDVVSFPSGGEVLYAVRLRQPGSAARLTVLLSHGKGGDISRAREWARAVAIWQAGFDVYAYDYRGYGKSTGKSTGETTLLQDGRAALAYVLAQPRVTAQSLVLYGHSLGGVPTTALAVGLSGLRGLVLESVFASGEAMAQSATILDVPGDWLMAGTFDNVGKLPAIHAPILILAGSNDVQVPRGQTEQLFAHANEPKRMEIVAGAVHDNIPATLGIAAYAERLRALTELVRDGSLQCARVP